MATYSVKEILNAVYSGTSLSGEASAEEILNTVFSAGGDSLRVSNALTEIYDAGSISTGTLTLDRADGEVQKVTVTGDFTFAFTWLSGSGWQSLMLIATDIADYTISYPAGIHWVSGSAPEFGTSGKELLGFGYDGTTVYGWLV